MRASSVTLVLVAPLHLPQPVTQPHIDAAITPPTTIRPPANWYNTTKQKHTTSHTSTCRSSKQPFQNEQQPNHHRCGGHHPRRRPRRRHPHNRPGVEHLHPAHHALEMAQQVQGAAELVAVGEIPIPSQGLRRDGLGQLPHPVPGLVARGLAERIPTEFRPDDEDERSCLRQPTLHQPPRNFHHYTTTYNTPTTQKPTNILSQHITTNHDHFFLLFTTSIFQSF